ncbi:MAG: 30S ribosomal protein S6 [Acidobacteria bacterium]|nr:30S ribosomal protein S6 [Acidobacteriota bacterium]MCH8972103.1 30S ribosomal protein S6 [Acidobacteriota bacterium]MCZ6739236.1 30S ribosomal protein S6 [Actinomycetota bacterium]
MRDYEIMTIHRPDLTEDEIEAKITELESYLSDSGVSVTKRELWGKRRFAYEIDHMSEGYYSVLSIHAEPGAVDSIDRRLSLADEVVRHKIVVRANSTGIRPTGTA